MTMTDVGEGPVLVLLHAFPLDHRMWLPVAEQLADRGVRVIVPDLAGFGGAPVPDQEPSLDVMADRVLTALDDRGVTQFAVAGLSMGGYVVMALLRQVPDRIRAIALVDTKMSADPPEARTGRLVVADRVVADQSTESLVATMVPNLLGATTLAQRPVVEATVAQWIREADPAGVSWAQRAMAARPDSAADLAAFRGSALVLAGNEDVISPPAEQQSMAHTIPNAALVLLPGSGHLSAVEAPDAVAQALAHWAAAIP